MKTALVTGASGNLGREVVKKFLDRGYNVFGTVRRDDSFRFEFGENNFEHISVNLLDEEDALRAVASVISDQGKIDAAVLTAGGFAMGDIAGTKVSDIMHQYKLNFETAYNIARPVFLQMLNQNSGRIFLIGSRPGLDMKYSKGMVAYGLSKSLLFRLAEMMNEEGKNQNVVTSVIIPGTIDTPQNRKAMPGSDFTKWVKAEEIADVITYYCSEEAMILREPVIKVYGNF